MKKHLLLVVPIAFCLIPCLSQARFDYPACDPQRGYTSRTQDTDNDGLKDWEEDTNEDCNPDIGETDPKNADTDGDGLTDGIESDQRNNDVDGDGAINALDTDSDGDGIPDKDEDKNRNGRVDGRGESDPYKADTDGDGRGDLQEYADCRNNPNPQCRYSCTAGQLLQNDPSLSVVDSDGDGLFDWQEDRNSSCTVDTIAGVKETDPFNADSDGDGFEDSADQCPTVADPTNSCKGQCRPKQNLRLTDPNRDSDHDGLKDWEEDIDDDCLIEPDQNETDPLKADTDGDGIIDRFDGCYNPGSPAISPDEFEQGIPTTDEEMTCARNACVSGIPIPELKDVDRDGLTDKFEDKNNDCLAEIEGSNSETDRFNPDSDEDDLLDGKEDANHNGVVDKTETDPRNKDTDADEIPDGVEDKNHNGRVDADESSPLLQDTDGDKIPDKVEDKNHNGLCDKNEISCAYLPDTDFDGLPDGSEDCNKNGVTDPEEPNPRVVDSDGDTLTDGSEDINANCILDKGETSPTSTTTYGQDDLDYVKRQKGIEVGGCPIGASLLPADENDPRSVIVVISLGLLTLLSLFMVRRAHHVRG
ncbi:MAG: hypothetical protein HYS22_08245 [Deltaproteobacteria bacterium]|nr:hypothetical protein [Deltaproteobacteria bacterium]